MRQVLAGGGDCSGLGGYFDLSGDAIESLPPVMRLEGGIVHAGLSWLFERLMGELREPRADGSLIAEHLSQTLLVEALRLHLAPSLTARKAGSLA
jgi:hypothetical protein